MLDAVKVSCFFKEFLQEVNDLEVSCIRKLFTAKKKLRCNVVNAESC